MKNKYNEKDSAISFLLALFLPSILAIFFIIILSYFISPGNLENSLAYKIIATLISQIAFLIIYFVVTKTRKISFKEIKHKKLNFVQIFILLLISFCCLFLISPIINVYDSLITSFGIEAQTLPLDISNPVYFAYLLFAMGIFAPISEELLFRGVILQGLEKKGKTKAAILSALMFMIMHLSLHQTIYQFVLGIIMALIVLYTESIFASIFVHFVNNSFILIINYINPQLFDYKYLSSSYIFLAIILFMFAIFVVFNLLKWLKYESKKRQKNGQKTLKNGQKIGVFNAKKGQKTANFGTKNGQKMDNFDAILPQKTCNLTQNLTQNLMQISTNFNEIDGEIFDENQSKNILNYQNLNSKNQAFLQNDLTKNQANQQNYRGYFNENNVKMDEKTSIKINEMPSKINEDLHLNTKNDDKWLIISLICGVALWVLNLILSL